MNQPKNFEPTIVKDFNNFLNYCEKAKPPISKTKEFIRRKDVFEINQLLTNPHEGLTARNDQNHYAQVHLFYHLALNGDLFQLDWSKKSKPCFAPNAEQIERFRTLNTTEQYVFLFQCFYVYSDFEEIVQDLDSRASVPAFEKGLRQLSQLEENKLYGIWGKNAAKEKIEFNFGNVMTDASLLFYGQYFGLWEVEESEEYRYKLRTFAMISTIKLSTFGKHFITFLVNNARPVFWNEPFRKSQGEKLPLGFPLESKLYEFFFDGEAALSNPKKEIEYQSFFTVIQPFFGEAIRADFEIELPKATKKGNFTLEVVMKYIKPKVTRTIKMGNHLTLEDLHYAIINSVDFDDDHLYAFYLNKNKRNSYGRMYEYGEPPFACDFTLADLGLSVNKRFNYTFDFGDNWEFVITIKDFEETDVLFDEPKLIAQKGKSPEQYPSWDDEEEW